MKTELQLEILKRVQDEINEAQADGHVITDDWFPFDDDLDVNIWTADGVTRACVYPMKRNINGDTETDTSRWTELFSERLTWRVNKDGQDFFLQRDENEWLVVTAFCSDTAGEERLVDITWCIGADTFEYLSDQLP